MNIVKTLLKLALLGSQWVMWLLLGLSVVSIAAMVERWIYLRAQEHDVDELGDKLCDRLERGEIEEATQFLEKRGTIEAGVLARAMRWISGGPEAFTDAVDAEMTKKKKDLDRGMNLLGTLGSNGPFIGLLGTVIGVIEAFNQLGAGGDKNAMAGVMVGIAEALVATGVGLFVAIPAVVAYNVFQKRIAEIEDNVNAVTKQTCALLKAVRALEGNHAKLPARRTSLESAVTGAVEPELAS